MNSSKVVAGLAAFNVLLLVAVAWQASLLREQRTELSAARAESGVALDHSAPSSSSSSELPTENPESAKTNLPAPAKATPPPAAKSITSTNRPHFDWQQVESSDYRTYIKNLRAIGCPEQTVRDIVLADVTQAFAAKRAEVMAERFREFEYWKADQTDAAARQTLERQRHEVDDAMVATLRELLGPDTLPPATTAEWQQAALQQQLSFLPADSREQTLSLLQQYAQVDALIKGLSCNHPPPASPESREERLRVIEEYNRKREALHALLTPEQYERVDMTASWTADGLRRRMARFQPTEDEFRIIFRAWRAHDEYLAGSYARGEPDPGNAHVFAEIARQLSPERYALYRQTW